MLAAPIINGTLPAFYVENGIATIAIPFSMNRGVNKNEIKAFSLKLKNVQGSSYFLTKESSYIDYGNMIAYFELKEKEDDLKNLYVGLFYKAQLAYIDQKNTVGYYSTVGVIKYTTKPSVSILNMKKSANNGHIYSYTGVYSQYNQDTTEKVYSYCFVVEDENENILVDTDWIIHNNSTDTNQYESYDTFFFDRDMLEGEKLKIYYKVKTNNNLEISSPKYRITAKKTVVSNLANTQIIAKLNYENAYVEIKLKGEIDEYGYEVPAKGYYLLSRTSEDSNYTQWDEIDRFTFAGERPSKKSWKDFTIEQGKNYKYSIQQYNNQGLFSERVYSDAIYSDFEYCFLYDGERQLKIKFNPKVSSFKIDRLEAKVDTLGSKFPFIFRNGNVEYKEFPISGLISYQADEEGLFLFKNVDLFKNPERQRTPAEYKLIEIFNFSDYSRLLDKLYIDYDYNYYPIKYAYEKFYKYNDIYKEYYDRKTEKKVNNYGIHYLNDINDLNDDEWKEYNSKEVYDFFSDILHKSFYYYIPVEDFKINHVNLTSDNLYLEREFKLEALNWLTNGKPKLFKSPTEGNYLIRLMNVSLTPNDTLGRMLHTFNSTAYEIADNTYDSLVNCGIIDIKNNKDTYLKLKSIPLITNDNNYAIVSGINYLPSHPTGTTRYATGELVPSGYTLEKFTIEDITPGTKLIIDGQDIIVGSTGTYSSQIPVSSVIIPLKQIQINDADEYYSQSLYNEDSKLMQEDYYKETSKYQEGKKYFVIDANGNYKENKNITDEETYNLEKDGRPIYFDYLPSWDEKVLIEKYDPYYYQYYIPETEITLKYVEIRNEEEFEKIKKENNGQIYGPMFAKSTSLSAHHKGGFWFYKPSIDKYIKDTLLGESYSVEESKAAWNGREIYEGSEGVYYIPQKVAGQINVVYYSEISNSFNNVLNTSTFDVYGQQFIGEQENIIEQIEDAATNILNFFDIQAYLRPLEECYYVDLGYLEVPNEEVNEENYFDYYQFNVVSQEYEPSFSDYSENIRYFIKRFEYRKTLTNSLLISYNHFSWTGVKVYEVGEMNPLYGYYYQVEPQDTFGLPLMKLVNFKDVLNSDEYDENKNIIRDLKERSASNPLVMDIVRDYPLLMKTNKLYWFDKSIEAPVMRTLNKATEEEFPINETNRIYCLLTPYTVIITPESYTEKKYMSAQDYDDFVEFMTAYNIDMKIGLDWEFNRWNTNIQVNKADFELKETKHFSSGSISTLNSLASSIGVYFELYYQKQEIGYDISKIAQLTALKEQIEEYRHKLSREYVEEKCIKNNEEDKYIDELYNEEDGVLTNYSKVYNQYISLLERYLYQINKEG